MSDDLAARLREQGLRLTVRAVGEQGVEGPPSGEWTFDLRTG